MKIDHVAMYVVDLEKVKDFFIQYFEAIPNELYHNPRTGLRTYILSFAEGARLEVMNRPEVKEMEANIFGQGFIHLSFSLGSREKVDNLTNRLKEDGYTIASGPRITGDGYYESCVVGPEGNLLELTV